MTASGYGGGPGAWVPTGSLSVGRDNDAAVLLTNGRVLVVGGQDRAHLALSSAELYDPATGTFVPTGPLSVPRAYPAATLLGNGDVLVAGGRGPGPTVISSAEIYDPTTGTWTPTTGMNDAGYDLVATLLDDGDVLVSGFPSAPAEVYDPANATWTDTGPLVAPGLFSSETLLSNGDVLAAGGPSTTAALYDPTTNDWTATGSMKSVQIGPTATLLEDGDVLVAGGETPNQGDPLTTSELYDSDDRELVSHAWPDERAPRRGNRNPLTNGQVLATGGCTAECDTRSDHVHDRDLRPVLWVLGGGRADDPGARRTHRHSARSRQRPGHRRQQLLLPVLLVHGISTHPHCCPRNRRVAMWAGTWCSRGAAITPTKAWSSRGTDLDLPASRPTIRVPMPSKSSSRPPPWVCTRFRPLVGAAMPSPPSICQVTASP